MSPPPDTLPAPVPVPFAVAATALIFLSALLGATLPLHFLSHLSPHSTLLCQGHSFSAGILTAAALVHLFPAGDRALQRLFPESDFPFSGVLALMGVALVLFMDSVTAGTICAKQHQHEQQTPLLGDVAVRSTSKYGDANTPTKITRSHSSSVNAVGGYMLAAALSMHAWVEGITLGTSIRHGGEFLAVLAAIVAHKTFAAMSLGTSLLGELARGKRGVWIVVSVFALLTPIGVGMGVLALSGMGDWEGGVVSASMNCVSAGVFVYVVFGELLRNEADVRVVGFLVGGGLMSLLAIWV